MGFIRNTNLENVQIWFLAQKNVQERVQTKTSAEISQP